MNGLDTFLGPMPVTRQAPPPVVPAVTGIDLSLTGTGVVKVQRSDTDRTWQFASRLITSESSGSALEARLERQSRLVKAIVRAAYPSALVVIEAPSYGSRGGSAHERSGLWWRVIAALSKRSQVVEVPPKTRAMYGCGNGNGDKAAVLASVQVEFPGAGIEDHNLADGLVLAAMGWRWLGDPVDAVTAKQESAMRKVRWPERKEQVVWQ